MHAIVIHVASWSKHSGKHPVHQANKQPEIRIMADTTEKLTEFEDKVIEFFTNVQESVVDGMHTVVDKVEDRVPEVTVPYRDQLPTADELVDNGFGFAQKLLDNQKAFAGDMLKVTAPVRDKFVAPAPKKPTAVKKPAATTTKKAA